ncbi:hypothetical protein HPP92_025337 [Vanilla planifolia]|uniref:Glycosyltransferase n=1 Tax=Vanilla planifolia TaxID=51239 RepID=A0A835PJT6_VANPL|nr:hypothetical protein HPP92_025337 [Vanilla planifolia]
MASTAQEKKLNVACSGHALVFPYPSQGHVNPMIQFAKRIASHNHRVTVALTRFVASTVPAPLATTFSSPVSIATISDGFDEGGFSAAPSPSAYLASLESVGGASLVDLLRSLADRGDPVSVVVYDSFLPWALHVARQNGAAAAAFFSQSAAVNAVYYHAREGRLRYPLPEDGAAVEGLPGLPRLESDDLPSLVKVQTAAGYASFSEMLLNQFNDLDKADVMLVNTFNELEPQEMDWLTLVYVARAIGPTVPSAYLDDRIPGDNTYALNLFPLESSACKAWISAVPVGSGVYASFGSLAELSAEQITELAHGLLAAHRPFLWVVRDPDAGEAAPGFSADAERTGGIVVRWASQMEVLSSGAVGCFVTHCGWNSTMEGLALGVPMVGMPQWTDQPTDAKYLEDVWEVERCIREVMEGERSSQIRRRAAEWREASRRAVDAGGSSDRNVVEFLERCCKPAGGRKEL